MRNNMAAASENSSPDYISRGLRWTASTFKAKLSTFRLSESVPSTIFIITFFFLAAAIYNKSSLFRSFRGENSENLEKEKCFFGPNSGNSIWGVISRRKPKVGTVYSNTSSLCF